MVGVESKESRCKALDRALDRFIMICLPIDIRIINPMRLSYWDFNSDFVTDSAD